MLFVTSSSDMSITGADRKSMASVAVAAKMACNSSGWSSAELNATASRKQRLQAEESILLGRRDCKDLAVNILAVHLREISF